MSRLLLEARPREASHAKTTGDPTGDPTGEVTGGELPPEIHIEPWSRLGIDLGWVEVCTTTAGEGDEGGDAADQRAGVGRRAK